MKKIILSAFLALPAPLLACPLCNKKIMDGIHESQFHPNLLTMMSAFIVLALVVIFFSARSLKKPVSDLNPSKRSSSTPLSSASIVLGIGAGGFIDGIFFHQVSQVHAMLSAKIPATEYIGKSVNMFWDGVFHFFCLLIVLTGIILLWKLLSRKEVNRSGFLLAGGLLTGWGLFNIIEGIINHHLLRLHNVVELSADHDKANFSFLGISVILLIAGLLITRMGSKHTSSPKEQITDHSTRDII